MNIFKHFLTVTLLVITIALSSSLATSHTSSPSAASSSASSTAPASNIIFSVQQPSEVTHLQRLQQQEHHLQQQRQTHKQREHHHRSHRIHNHQHLHERSKPVKELQPQGNTRTAQSAVDSLQHRQQQQQPQVRQIQQQQETQQQSRKNATTTTQIRLRRVSARDYYNRATMTQTQHQPNPKKRIDDDKWLSYNNNNNNNNNNYSFKHRTRIAQKSSSVGEKLGDDKAQDVEMLNLNNIQPIQWNTNASPTTRIDASLLPPASPLSSSSSSSSSSAAAASHRIYGYVPSALNPSLTPHVPRRALFVPATVTSAPPPLVAERRHGVALDVPAASSVKTETHFDDATGMTAFGGSTMGRNYPLGDAQEMERRHICVQQRTVHMPVKTTEIYTRPTWKHVPIPCQTQTHTHTQAQAQAHIKQMCTRVQIIHEPAYRDVIRHKSAQQVTYDCCAGWMREKPQSDACMLPICSHRCQNGGTCSSPDTCTCPPGFTGRYCENDINECKERKPCDQTCINTVGSYICVCREGFVLQEDQESCKKIDFHGEDAFEARDLENEIETNDDIAIRLQKIEHSLAKERVQTQELEKSLVATHHVVDSLKSRLSTLEKQQQDLNRLQANLYATETRTNKLEGMLNLMMKCRNPPNAQCP